MMSEISANLNKELYSKELVGSTIERNTIFDSEAFILQKYLTNKTGHVIEAGSGAGLISFYIEQMGFSNVEGFDIVPQLVEYANNKALKSGSKVCFSTGDAANLTQFADGEFDYLIYLQNIICFVPEEQLQDALNESFRIAKKGSITIYSFLNYHARPYNPFLSFAVNVLRWIRGEKISKYYLPWLKHHFTQTNWKFLNKNQPRLFWTTKAKISAKLKQTGFEIIEANVGSEIKAGTPNNLMYIVCGKL